MSREGPALEVDGSLSGQRMVMVLARLTCPHGRPKGLWEDKGPEFTSKACDEWAQRRGVNLAFSRPGPPRDTPLSRACNARCLEECLKRHGFIAIEEARTTMAAWRVEYHPERPHTALPNQAPAVYKATWLQNQEAQTTHA